MNVRYIDHMGSDLMVVNAARVSFAKEHKEFDSTKDTKLVGYLAKHNHFTPFAHPQVCLQIKAPIFVARQLIKHQVGLVWNEESRRYVDTDPTFFFPSEWREKVANKKQGSGKPLNMDEPAEILAWVTGVCAKAYTELLELGVCEEQARIVLPLTTETQWYWTGSLAAWARVWKLRVTDDAQKETRDVIEQIGPIMEKLFPVSWEKLINDSVS